MEINKNKLSKQPSEVQINYYDWWKPLMENGRQRWCFDPPLPFQDIAWNSEKGAAILAEMQAFFKYNTTENPNTSDKVLLFHKQTKHKISFTQTAPENTLEAAIYKSGQYLNATQEDAGNWAGDYGGPMFLLPGLIIVSYITSTPFHLAHGALMKQYMLNHQNDDGGWGMHIEGASTMFGTVMQYVALRLLQQNPNSESMTKARHWIKQHGGATHIPSWGKFYLSVLGIYEWKGCNSLMPEMWLLPKSWDIHPSHYWCHARMVYLPMSYCFGVKLKAARDEITTALLSEIYIEQYEKINWEKARNSVSSTDVFVQQGNLLKYAFKTLNQYEKFVLKKIRKKALEYVKSYIEAEDIQTNYINIGPVNQIINSLAVWHFAGKNSDAFQRHVERWNDYLWVAEDGMKMNGYNGSQLWDTAFATQALLHNNMANCFEKTMDKAQSYIAQHQIQEEPFAFQKFFRHSSVGGWPFSTLEHGWPITDCTAEGLKSLLQIRKYATASAAQNKLSFHFSETQLFQAVDLILSFQNKDGGWATYELQRAPAWTEFLNPSEVFGKIMTDYSWTECTSACMQALYQFQTQFKNYKNETIKNALQRGRQFILKQQKKDGSWEGAWAVCFTYGTWFGIEALLASGSKNYNQDEALQKACDFLVTHQDEQGAWGESYLSCVKKKYIPHPQPQVVNTAWALMSLLRANYPKQEILDRAAQFLIAAQEPEGSWKQGGISGVFNLNCMISYTNYRNIFPLWALGLYQKYLQQGTSSKK